MKDTFAGSNVSHHVVITHRTRCTGEQSIFMEHGMGSLPEVSAVYGDDLVPVQMIVIKYID